MPNKRSLLSLQKRAVKRYLLTTSYYDRERAETVCTVTPAEIILHLNSKFPNLPVHVSTVQVVRGEVLMDSRGKGSLQKQREVKHV